MKYTLPIILGIVLVTFALVLFRTPKNIEPTVTTETYTTPVVEEPTDDNTGEEWTCDPAVYKC